MRRVILIVFVVLLLLGVGAVAGAYWWVNRPYAGFAKEVILDIPPGTSTTEMARVTGK